MKHFLILLFCLSFTASASKQLHKTGRAIDDHGPKFDPIISANFLVLYDHSQILKESNGFKIQEILLQFGATVDKLFEAEVFLGIEQLEDREKFDVFPIGVFGETRKIKNLNFRAGQFLNHFGEHNARYKHNFPFILAPLINQEMFGERGLNFIGLGIDWKSLFNNTGEITFEITQGKNHELFEDFENHYLANFRYWGHWEFENDHNLKVGLSGAVAEVERGLWGVDLNYNHILAPNHNFNFRFEYMGKIKHKRQGLYSHLKYQFYKEWELSYRYDYTGLEKERIDPISQKHSIMISALPTYFSGVRLEYSYLKRGDGISDNRVLFQINQTIGPRRAHSY